MVDFVLVMIHPSFLHLYYLQYLLNFRHPYALIEGMNRINAKEIYLLHLWKTRFRDLEELDFPLIILFPKDCEGK
jgi:hypothetical protein